jgi:hypothetical protein
VAYAGLLATSLGEGDEAEGAAAIDSAARLLRRLQRAQTRIAESRYSWGSLRLPSSASFRSSKTAISFSGELVEALAEHLPGGHQRPKTIEEVVRPSPGRLPLDRRRVALELEVGGIREHLADVALGPPEDRRLGEIRRRRHVGRARREHVPDGSLRRPAADRDQPAFATDARHLICRAAVAWRKHVTEGGEDAVEARALERQLLGVALDPLDLDSSGLRFAASGVEEFWREIEARHVGTGARRGQRGVARAARDVEDAHPGLDPGAADDALADAADQLRKRRVIACLPDRTLPLLELLHRRLSARHPLSLRGRAPLAVRGNYVRSPAFSPSPWLRTRRVTLSRTLRRLRIGQGATKRTRLRPRRRRLDRRPECLPRLGEDAHVHVESRAEPVATIYDVRSDRAARR